MFYLTGVYKDAVKTSLKFVGVLSEGPRQSFSLEGLYYRPFNVYTYKHFYYKSERNFYLKSSYNAFGKSFNLTSFYFKIKDKTFFTLEGKYQVKNYDKFTFYGRYSVARKAFYRFHSSYKVRKLSISFLKSYYPGLKFNYIELNGIYSQFIPKTQTTSFSFIGAYESYKEFVFRNIKQAKISIDFGINKTMGKSRVFPELPNSLYDLNTFSGTRNYKDYSTFLAEYDATIYKDILPTYSSVITITIPNHGRANSSKYDLCLFSAHGHIMSDFYSRRMELTIMRHIVEYKEPTTLHQIPLDITNIEFKNSFTQKFLYVDIYKIEFGSKSTLIKLPNTANNKFLVDNIQLIFKTNAQKIKYHNTDIFYSFKAISTSFKVIPTRANASYKNLFALRSNIYYHVSNMKIKQAVKISVKQISYKLTLLTVNAKLDAIYKDPYYLNKELNIKPFSVYRDVYSKIDFNFNYSLHSSIVGNKFGNNLHRHYYTKKDAKIINSFTTVESYSVDEVTGIRGPVELSISTYLYDDLYKGEYTIIQPKNDLIEFKNYFVTVLLPKDTNDFYLVASYLNASYRYIKDVKELNLGYNLEVNSHNIKELLEEFILAKVRPN